VKLLASLTSPFARKVRIVLLEKNIECQLVVDIPWNADTQVPQFNPLGKVPVLILDDGQTVFDSRVIVEYLDTLLPNRAFIPQLPQPMIAVKRQEALADGIADAAATIFIERRRPEQLQSQDWIARQQQKMALGLAAMETTLGDAEYFVDERFTLADIATVCCLGYLDFRFAELKWRELHPNLGRFMQRMSDRSSVSSTVPVA
jgi:glutathione S-transferase